MAANPYPINVPVGTGFPPGVVPQPGLPPGTQTIDVYAQPGQSTVQKILAGLKTAEPFLTAGGRAAAGLETGRTAGRTAEADIAKSQYELERDAYQNSIRDAIRGSLMKNLQDSKITAPAGIQMGTITGGARPSAFANREQVGGSLEADAMKHVMEGSPEVPTLPQATGLDKGLNIASQIASGTGLVGSLLKQGANQAVNYGVNKGINAGVNAATGGGAAAGGAAGAGGGAAGNGASSAGGGMWSTSPATMGIGAGIGIGGNLASQYLPAGAPRTAGSYASTGASIGAMAGPIGMGIGAGVGAIIGAIKGHQNHTKGQREEFAQAIGLPNIDTLYTELAKKGPEGVKLVDEGLHIIGKNDIDQNTSWMQRAAAVLGLQ